ncbi:MAG: FtsW/RodA/SpoVE family cell cycle protein [Candidatus Absconditabacteria bacterium]
MPILLCGLALIVFGIFAIYSVSIHESFTLTLKLISQGNRDGDPSNYFYFLRQLKNIAIGLVMGVGIYLLPLGFFQKNKNIIIIGVIMMILQLAVFIPGIGVTLNGARGWINIPLLGSLQPAEFFKLGYVLFFASWLIRKRDIINTKQFFSNFIVINVLLFFVFLLIPDLGTLLILSMVALVMSRYSGEKVKYILIMVFGGLITALLAGSVAGLVSDKFDYIQKRFTYFLNTNVDPQSRDVGWQNQQALIAVGGGGFSGKGYGKGLQKFGYIPEAQSDFIFAAYSEEIGMLGDMFLLAMYLFLAYYFISKLPQVRNEYNKTIGVGIIALIMIQAFVNMGVNLRILPNTGLTLPFISYGGTAMMVNIIEIVLLYKITKEK